MLVMYLHVLEVRKLIFIISLLVFRREDPRDALVLHPKHVGKSLETLPKGSVIGKQNEHITILF